MFKSFKNGNFWPKKQVFGLKSLVKSKLFDLESSFRAQNIRNYMHLLMHEFTSDFFFEFGIRDQLNFVNGSNWYSKTRWTGLQILVKSKLLVLVPSNMA